MPQVSLYVDDTMMADLRRDAANENLSLSKLVAKRLRAAAPVSSSRCATPSGLPDGFFERLYGSIDDDSFVRPAQPPVSNDAPRTAFE